MNITENFYKKLRMIRERNLNEFTGPSAPAFMGKSRPSSDERGTGVTTQPSGAKLTTPSKIEPTKYSGETSSFERNVKGPVKSALRAVRSATGMTPMGLKSNMPVMNKATNEPRDK